MGGSLAFPFVSGFVGVAHGRFMAMVAASTALRAHREGCFCRAVIRLALSSLHRSSSAAFLSCSRLNPSALPQHRLCFFTLPQGHGLFRGVFMAWRQLKL